MLVNDPGKLDGALQSTPALGVQLLASGSSRAARTISTTCRQCPR